MTLFNKKFRKMDQKQLFWAMAITCFTLSNIALSQTVTINCPSVDYCPSISGDTSSTTLTSFGLESTEPESTAQGSTLVNIGENIGCAIQGNYAISYNGSFLTFSLGQDSVCALDPQNSQIGPFINMAGGGPVTFEYADTANAAVVYVYNDYSFGIIGGDSSQFPAVQLGDGMNLIALATINTPNDFQVTSYSTINIAAVSPNVWTLSGQMSETMNINNPNMHGIPFGSSLGGTVIFNGDISTYNVAMSCFGGTIQVPGSTSSSGGVSLTMIGGTLEVTSNGALFGLLNAETSSAVQVGGLMEFTGPSSTIQAGVSVYPIFSDNTAPLIFYLDNSAVVLTLDNAFTFSDYNPIQYTGSGLVQIMGNNSTYPGGTLIQSYNLATGENTGSGNVTFNSSSIVVSGSVTAGPFGTGAITLEGSLLTVSDTSVSIDNPIIVPYQTNAFLGCVNNSSATTPELVVSSLDSSGNLTINSSSQLGIGASTTYGKISIQGISSSLACTISGSLTIAGGVLSIGEYTNLNPSSVSNFLTISSPAELDILYSITSIYPIVLGNGNMTINVSSGATATFTGTVEGSSSTVLTVLGGGTLSLLPTAASASSPLLIPCVPSLVVGDTEDSETTFIGNTYSLINSKIVVNTGSVLQFQQSISGSYAGGSGLENTVIGISGPGSVEINGGTGVVLTFEVTNGESPNTYTGSTVLNSGILSISKDSCLGNNNSSMGSVGSVTGNGGTLQITDNITTSRDFIINPSSTSDIGITFDINQNSQYTLSGTLTGNGYIDVTGGGTFEISSSATTSGYLGKVNVVSGSSTFINKANMPNDPIIERRSLIKGNGIIGPLEIYGYLSDLGKEEALTVIGNTNFYNDSALITSTNATNCTKVVGAITVYPGAAVYLALTPGDFSEPRTFLAIQSTEGITGDFGHLLVPSSYFLNGFSTNNSQAITVTVSPSEVLSYKQKGNALSVQNGLNASIAWNRSNVYYVSASGEGLSFISPIPKVSAVLATFLPLEGEEIKQALLACQSSSLKNLLIVQENSSTQVQSVLRERMENRMNMQDCIDNDRFYTVWAEGIGNVMSQHDRNGYIGYKSHMAGAVLGLEKSFYNTIYLGMLGGYTSAHVQWEDHFGVGNANAGYFGLYSSLLGDMFYGNIAVTGGWNIYNAKRNITYTGVSLQATSSHGGKQLLSHADGGVNIRVGKFTLRPFDAFDYLTQTENGYTEKQASEWNLTVKKSNAIFLRNELGLQFAGCIDFFCGTWSLSPKLSWVREVRVKGGNTSEEFSATDDYFKVTSYFPNRSLLSPGVTLTGSFLENLLRCSAYYNGEFGSGYSSNQYGGEVSLSF